VVPRRDGDVRYAKQALYDDYLADVVTLMSVSDKLKQVSGGDE